jgi:hypothetical protein
MTKAHSSKYHPCILTLTENDYHEVMINDPDNKILKNGHKNSIAKVDVKYINSINTSDILSEYMLEKFKDYLNI